MRLHRITSALAWLGDEQLVSELLGLAERCACDTSSVAIAYTLGHLSDARAVAPLVAMLGDERASDRKRALASQDLGIAADRGALSWLVPYATRVNYLAAPPSLSSTTGDGLLEQR